MALATSAFASLDLGSIAYLREVAARDAGCISHPEEVIHSSDAHLPSNFHDSPTTQPVIMAFAIPVLNVESSSIINKVNEITNVFVLLEPRWSNIL